MPDIVTSKIFVDGEKGISATKMNQIISGAVIQPDFYTAKSTSSTLDPTDTLLELKSTGSYAQIAGSQLINSVSANVSANITPTITAVRLRSSLAIGNGSMEVDQINCGATVANANAKIIDRWNVTRSGTMVVSAGQNAAAYPDVCIPGTSFRITRTFLRIIVTTAQTSLGASDFLQIGQSVEGPQWRELSNDVHAVSLLVRSSVAGLNFGLTLRDPPTVTKSLSKLCNIPSANTWTLIPLNLPIWPSSGNFTAIPGNVGYQLSITLAAGTSLTNSANDVWTNSNTFGALGQSNFAATSGATFDLAYVGHEPGLATTLMDCSFGQNLDGPMGCTRYYQKSYPYANAPGTITPGGCITFQTYPNANPTGPIPFKKIMARTPSSIVGYSTVTGAAGQVRDIIANVDRAISSVNGSGDYGFSGFGISTANAANAIYQFHYCADTGL